MEQRIPFTSYDTWAYLSAGFLLLFAIDYVAATHLLARDSWTVAQAVMALVSAYVVGQLVASASSVLLEKILVGELLGPPRLALFGEPKAWRWVRRLLPGYFQPLAAETQKALLDKAAAAGITRPGEGLFWLAFSYARSTPPVLSRLENFLNLYGFCRNVALVALLDACILFWHYRWGKGDDVSLQLSRAALVVGLGMTLRYLKFYRHYALEVFTSFAHAKEPPAAAEKKT